jgi:non-homologous end joining protein Ku
VIEEQEDDRPSGSNVISLVDALKKSLDSRSKTKSAAKSVAAPRRTRAPVKPRAKAKAKRRA